MWKDLENWLNLYVWPFKQIYALKTQISELRIEKSNLERQNGKVRLDFRKLATLLTDFGINWRELTPKPSGEPLVVAYGLGAAVGKYTKGPGNGKDTLADVQYLFLEPVVLRHNIQLDMKLKDEQNKMQLKHALLSGMMTRFEESAERVVDDLLLEMKK